MQHKRILMSVTVVTSSLAESASRECPRKRHPSQQDAMIGNPLSGGAGHQSPRDCQLTLSLIGPQAPQGEQMPLLT